MRHIFHVIIAIVTLGLGMVALPASAYEGLQSKAYATPVISKSGLGGRTVGEVTVGEVVFVAASAAAAGTVARILFNNGWLTILSVAIGAAGGSYWYLGEWPNFWSTVDTVDSSIKIGRR
jgi:predicted lysophospholipase L1 biosynthesis ABC-type transport system permease subunit